MATIPAETKKQLPGTPDSPSFVRNTNDWRKLNDGIVGLVKKAVGNKIADDQPYTFRINFQNGRIVGETFDPRFSIEKLEGRTPTTEFALSSVDEASYFEAKKLYVSYFPEITNGNSWVARFKMVNGKVTEAFVNSDFDDPEDRKLIKDALFNGFRDLERL
ncbi:MAG: hypothetical protein HXO60_06990 [Rothia mucilaginosa]|uniref:hypothetical protein n=1 Tax=Rothia mucilaginosa TaxID=43675 RepID=UPI001CB3B3FA|nr:hypothetical protein [Rothia mucilaginosa]MBF1652229.1 hypothetical protein [Rothia mucilaginosa]